MKEVTILSKKFHYHTFLRRVDVLIIVVACIPLIAFAFLYNNTTDTYQNKVSDLSSKNSTLSQQLSKSQSEVTNLKNEDQRKRNDKLQAEIDNINKLYKQASDSYQTVIDLRDQKIDTADMEKSYVKVIADLSNRNYATASSDLTSLNGDIKKEQDKLAAAQAAAQAAALAQQQAASAASLPTSNTLNAGLNQQKVHSDVGDFQVAVISADLGSTRVIVDTASDSDCHDNCPVLSLSDYVSRNGAFAGINGNYFCPASYPSCAGKTNSFDLLVMNKNKHYFNSDNNVYSTNPAAIFQGGSVRFVSQSLQWGRDTSPDSVISNYPLLVSGNSIVFGGNSDPKMGSVGTRCFVGATGSTVYIGIVYNATMTEAAHVIHAMGIADAMNLDEGGSTALMWQGRYLAGPGRNIPDAVLFVHK